MLNEPDPPATNASTGTLEQQRRDGHQDAHSDHGSHAGHSHAVNPNADRRYLWTALILLLAFMAFEVVVGLVSGSLALLADAGHMTSDAGAIGLALLAIRLAAKPAWGAYTFGLKRAEILSAMANGATRVTLTLADGSVYTLKKGFKDPGLKAGEKVQVSWDMNGAKKIAEQVSIEK